MLTLVNSANPIEQSAWEIVRVTVAGGVASVTLRGQEGTIEQDWLAGALVYCAVTAATLNQLSTDTASVGQRLTDLETGLPMVLGQIGGMLDALALRVAALEGGTPPDPGGGDGLLTDAVDNILTDDQNQPLEAGTV